MGPPEGAVSALAWALCSIGMTLLNKLAVKSTQAPLGVLLLQMSVTSIVVLVQPQALTLGEARCDGRSRCPAYSSACSARAW